jgi:hypothetical protein
MGKGHYLGGSTIIGPGRYWSDSNEFGDNGSWTLRQKAKKPRRRKRSTARSSLALRKPDETPPMRTSRRSKVNAAKLVIPASCVALIIGVFSDLGRAPSKKRNRLNNWLKRLIGQGIIADDGTPNKQHPIFHEWLAKVDKERNLQSGRNTSAT